MKRCLLWFRRDLRLDDNSALAAAIASGTEILPVYIHGTNQVSELSEGGASQWWLHHALKDLDDTLQELGAQLHLIKAHQVAETVFDLVRKYEIEAVFWNRRYQPAAIELDAEIKKQLRHEGVEVQSYNSSVMNEPHAILNLSGRPYQVFTP